MSRGRPLDPLRKLTQVTHNDHVSSTTTPPWTLGDALAKGRRLRHMTQQELAIALGISRRSVSRYEEDQQIPSRAVRMAWAMVCGVPYDWFATEDDSEPGSADRRRKGSRPTTASTSRKGAKVQSDVPRTGHLRAVA